MTMKSFYIEGDLYFFTTKGSYGFLSNFWISPIVIDGIEYLTVENYYQSQKTTDSEISKWIASAPTPFLAKRAGHCLREGKEFRDDWEKIKVDVMLKGLHVKFADPILSRMLLNTGNKVLHEDNRQDEFWGVGGEDMLGKLLMKVREEIRL